MAARPPVGVFFSLVNDCSTWHRTPRSESESKGQPNIEANLSRSFESRARVRSVKQQKVVIEMCGALPDDFVPAGASSFPWGSWVSPRIPGGPE